LRWRRLNLFAFDITLKGWRITVKSTVKICAGPCAVLATDSRNRYITIVQKLTAVLYFSQSVLFFVHITSII
jgi:hypothetical protein